MKKFKIIIALLCILTLTLSITACGKDTTQQELPAENQTVSQDQTKTVLAFSNAISYVADNYWLFKDLNQNVSITLYEDGMSGSVEDFENYVTLYDYTITEIISGNEAIASVTIPESDAETVFYKMTINDEEVRFYNEEDKSELVFTRLNEEEQAAAIEPEPEQEQPKQEVSAIDEFDITNRDHIKDPFVEPAYACDLLGATVEEVKYLLGAKHDFTVYDEGGGYIFEFEQDNIPMMFGVDGFECEDGNIQDGHHITLVTIKDKGYAINKDVIVGMTYKELYDRSQNESSNFYISDLEYNDGEGGNYYFAFISCMGYDASISFESKDGESYEAYLKENDDM